MIVYWVAPLRSKVWDAPSGEPAPPLACSVNHETLTEIGPLPSVVTVMVAVEVVGPVWLKADTATFLTAGATGGVEEAVVGVAGVDVGASLGVVACVGEPVAEAVAEG